MCKTCLFFFEDFDEMDVQVFHVEHSADHGEEECVKIPGTNQNGEGRCKTTGILYSLQ